MQLRTSLTLAGEDATCSWAVPPVGIYETNHSQFSLVVHPAPKVIFYYRCNYISIGTKNQLIIIGKAGR
jgi:hypothetical protein